MAPVRRYALALAAALIANLFGLGTAPAAAEEYEFDQYRIIDATSLWVFHEGQWQRLRLASVDSPKNSARRQPTQRLTLPMDYAEIRKLWVAWIRQVGLFSELSTQATEKLLEKAEKRRWEKAHDGPAQSSEVRSGTTWVNIRVGGEDLGETLVREGWAIPWIPPGLSEPDRWDRLLEKMQSAMSDCAGIWNDLLLQCAPSESAQ